jgi:hypothetical protein
MTVPFLTQVLVRVSLICPASAQVGSYLFPASQPPTWFPGHPKDKQESGSGEEVLKGLGQEMEFSN